MSTSPPYRVFTTRDSACVQVAAEIAQLIRERAIIGRTAVLGLMAGKSPLPLYQELIYLHREENLSFRNVVTFNLNEYLGLEITHPASYRSFMQRNLFDHLDIRPANTHFLSAAIDDVKITAHCANYEAKIARNGGIDYQVLGIDRSGEIGFNGPDTPHDSRTRRVQLSERIRLDAARAFGGIEQVPTHALTMGYGTILKARKIAVLAWGTKKASAVRKTLEETATPKVGAACLKTHPAARFFLNQTAAMRLRNP